LLLNHFNIASRQRTEDAKIVVQMNRKKKKRNKAKKLERLKRRLAEKRGNYGTHKDGKNDEKQDINSDMIVFPLKNWNISLAELKWIKSMNCDYSHCGFESLGN
jgi:hypothetical protein